MSDRPTRVSYREGQRLRAADLAAEQEYLAGLERGHNLAQHAPGVVSGLARGTNPAEIKPGIAVNAEGRLLVSEEPVPFDGSKCTDAWLIHCETAGMPRRGAPPSDPAQADRRQDVARVVITGTTQGGDAAAPTTEAVYLGRAGCGPDDVREPVYTSLTAASVSDPANRATMTLGEDFTIATTAPRIVLDRLGNNRFLGTVTLADYHYCELLRLTHDKFLKVEAKSPGTSGVLLHLLITPSRVNDLRRLVLQAYSGATAIGEPLIWKEASAVSVDQLIEQFTMHFKDLLAFPALFAKIPTLQPSFVRRSEMILSESDAKELFDRFSVQQDVPLRPCGGSLVIRDWPDRPGGVEPEFRGCDDEAPDPGAVSRDPAGLSFAPMNATPKAPPIPGIYSVLTGAAGHRVEELRVDLGAKRDNDLSTRFAIGDRVEDNDPFTPWLTLDGSCNVVLPAEAWSSEAVPVTLHVNGTIERGPIKPDIGDRNFTDLMSLAWLAGLRKGVTENQVVTVGFKFPQPPGDTSDPVAYTITVQNPSLNGITADGVTETITAGDGNPHVFSQAIKPGKGLPAGATTDVLTITHPSQMFPAGKVTVNAVVFGKSGGAYWWKHGEGSFVIKAAPVVDIAPDSVPPNTPFTAKVTVENQDATFNFTIDTITIDGNTQSPNVIVLPHQSATFDHAYAAAPANPVPVHITMTWDDGRLNTIDVSKTIEVKDDLKVTVDNVTPPTTSNAATFQLTLENLSGKQLTSLSVKQNVTGDFTTSPVLVPLGQNTLDAHASLVVGNATAGTPHAPVQHLTLELHIEYDRDGQTWKLPVVTKGIVP